MSIVNTVLPVLGGLFIDAFGTATGSFVTTLLITSGNVLVAYSTHNRSLMTMILGRVLYGIGSGTVVIVQETILSHWFSGRSLAGVVSLMLTTSRLVTYHPLNFRTMLCGSFINLEKNLNFVGFICCSSEHDSYR